MKTIPFTERQVCLNSLIFTYLHFLNKVIKLLPASGKRRCHEKWLWSIRIFFKILFSSHLFLKLLKALVEVPGRSALNAPDSSRGQQLAAVV